MSRPRGTPSDRQGAPSPSESLASVVVVDRRDDVAAVCGRLDAAPAFAVVVHAPDGNRQLSTQLGIRRLQRHAEDTGRVVAVATGSRSLAARARQAGLPVARRPEHIRWDAPGRRVLHLPGLTLALPGIGRYVQVSLLAATCLAVVVLFLALAPAATVRVAPPARQLELRVVIDAGPGRDSADLAALRVRARDVTATRTVTLAAPATGRALVPARPALAVVTLSNTSAQPVVIPLGAVAFDPASRQRFQLDQETPVPPGASAAQQVSALAPGPGGNVAPGAISRWEDAAFAAVTISNDAAAAGGASEERTVVADADIAALVALATSMASQESILHAIVDANPGHAVFLRSASASAQPGSPQPSAGSPASIVLLDVTFEITAVAADPDDVAALLAARLGGLAPGVLIPGTVRAAETGLRQSANPDTGVFASEFTITARFADGISPEQLRSQVRGRLTSRARSHLERRYGMENVALNVDPAVAPLVPWFSFRIDVEFVPGPPGQ